MQNNNNKTIRVPYNLEIKNAENAQAEVSSFLNYFPELMSQVNQTGLPAIVDLHVTNAQGKTEVLDLQIPIIPFNYKTNTVKDLDDFVRIANSSEASTYNANVNHLMLQTRLTGYLNDVYAYISSELAEKLGTTRAINPKQAYAQRTQRNVLKFKFNQMLDAINRYSSGDKTEKQPANN